MFELIRNLNQNGLIELDAFGKTFSINPINLEVTSPSGSIVKWSKSCGYDVCKFGVNTSDGKRTIHILKHRLIVFLYGDKYGKTINKIFGSGGKFEIVDHIDSDRENNIPSNLQIVSKRYNSSREKSLKSGLPTGVVWHKRDKKFMAYIKINGKTRFIGYFKTPEAASLAYQNKLKQINL